MRKRNKKYRPKTVIVNPVHYVIATLTKIADYDEYLVTLKIKNSYAMARLVKGEAERDDMDAIIAMSNITDALCRRDVGRDYHDLQIAGRDALVSIVDRSHRIGRYVANGAEIRALQSLLELHDAQMAEIRVGDLEKALDFVQSEIRGRRTTMLRAIAPPA